MLTALELGGSPKLDPPAAEPTWQSAEPAIV
jgi:hypothetical protein